MSLLGYGLAGAAQGLGNGLIEQANSKKEAALELLRQDRQDRRIAADRTFRTSERVAGQEFQLERAAGLKSDEKFETIYDEGTGQAIKAIVNTRTGEVVKTVGGPKAPSGLELEQGPDGSLRIATGNKGLSRKNEAAVEGKVLDVQEQRLRLKGMRDSVKDEYLTLTGRVKHLFNKGRALIDPDNLSPEDRKNYADYTSWKQLTINNINITIQSLTGAAMGVQEAKRIMSSMPNAQDDPIAFKAKMDAVLEQIDEKLDLYSRQRGKTPPTEIEQDGQPAPGVLPAGINQRRTIDGKNYLQDDSGNWFEE